MAQKGRVCPLGLLDRKIVWEVCLMGGMVSGMYGNGEGFVLLEV